MPHLSDPRRYFFHHSYRMLFLQHCPSLAGKTGGTRIDRYRPLIMPLRLRGSLRNTVPRILVQPSCSALISAFALRTLTSNKHISFISTLRISFRFGCGCSRPPVMLSMQSGATCLQGLRSVCIHVATPLKKAKPQVSMRKHSSCE